MSKTFIGVRDVDEAAFRKLRARAFEQKKRIGEALTEAIQTWLKEQHKKRPTENAKILLKMKPFSWGAGSEKTSEEVDEILYGTKK